MTSYQLIVVIDDDDRDEEPGRPWSAHALGPNGSEITVEAGIGATPEQAFTDMHIDWKEVQDV